VLVAAAAACAAGAWLGAWWAPFLVGVAVAAAPRGGVLPAALGAVAGWVIPLWVLALRGQPVGATARVIAALAGLPPYAGVTVAATAALALLQVLAGAWLGRTALPGRR
jgi:hypothetical protein